MDALIKHIIIGLSPNMSRHTSWIFKYKSRNLNEFPQTFSNLLSWLSHFLKSWSHNKKFSHTAKVETILCSHVISLCTLIDLLDLYMLKHTHTCSLEMAGVLQANVQCWLEFYILFYFCLNQHLSPHINCFLFFGFGPNPTSCYSGQWHALAWPVHGPAGPYLLYAENTYKWKSKTN